MKNATRSSPIHRAIHELLRKRHVRILTRLYYSVWPYGRRCWNGTNHLTEETVRDGKNIGFVNDMEELEQMQERLLNV